MRENTTTEGSDHGDMRAAARMWLRRPGAAAILFSLVVVFGLASTESATAAPKRVFMAPDDHTDYFWSATDVEYRQFFLSMLDYYINQAEATAGEPAEHQSRFSADGSLWLWEYEKHKTPGEFQRLVDALKSGHISAPKNPLVITYGGAPVEAVIRSMYYSGQLERRHGLDFPLAIAMENAGMSYGLGAVWAGAGVRYSWKGVCNCPSLLPDLDDREHEIYSWLGPDGSRILMKWNSLHNASDNQSIGGYAEARFPSAALDIVTRDDRFLGRYPYDTIGVFGQGWDDLLTTNLNIQQTCKANSDPDRTCIVSNSTDFFQEFDQLYGAVIPTISAGFGNEWDLSPASLAEVSARVKRSVERLRSAEALATLVSLENPSFLAGREAARDRAFLNLGLYFEHDFENGGPGVPGAVRIAWQRQVATEIEQYVNTLYTDAVSALGAMIQKTGTEARFFVFNPLSWVRTDVADLPYGGPLPAHVLDLTSGAEVPSQVVVLDGAQYLRIEAPDVPSVGYKVFAVRPGAGQVFANAPTVDASTGAMGNELYQITVSPRGAITSFVDKRLGNREFAGTIGGFALNDLGAGSGSRQVENVGPVSVTLVVTSPAPLAHVTRVTLTRGSDRVEIRNEVTQNFGGTRWWRFSFNLTNPDVRHEEVGAIARARLTTDGGSYSPRNARYGNLTLNHFADMSGAGSVGVTLSNADAYFMDVGNSGVTTLDTTTPQLSVMLGGELRPSNPIVNQAGDAHFLQRFALRAHGPYDQPGAMRFALAHQNPLTVGAVSGGSPYPEGSHSFLSISDPNVLLWALKPAEEGIGDGVIARVWNLAPSATTFSLALDEPIAAAKRVWHTETDVEDAAVSSGALTSSIVQNQLLSFRLFPASFPAAVRIVASDARAVESGKAGSFTISRTGSVASSLSVPYTVGGTATPGTDYHALPGIATIPAGASSVVIPVVPIADEIAEPDETIVVTLADQPQYVSSLWNSATVSLINAGAAPTVPDALFALNEGTGSTTTDVAGLHLGTLQNGALWTSGKYGNGLSFDGVDDHVLVPDASSLGLRGTGTIQAWIKLSSLNRWHGVISKGAANADPAHNYALEVDNSNRFLCILGNGSTALKVTSTTTALAGIFYHLACSWDGTAVRLYVNGVLGASIPQTITPVPNSLALYIGQFGVGADRLHGVIDEVRISDRARTQAEIQTDMNTPIGTTPPPTPDVASPTVTLTFPVSGATVSGTIVVAADASDNVGVAGVRFTLDGLTLGVEDTAAPYAINWNTTTATNGVHALRAVARDAAGNVGTAAEVLVTVDNATDTTPPTPPMGLAAAAVSSSRVDLSWGASSDNVGVTGYLVRRDGGVVAATTQTSHSDTGLTPGTSYTYTVAATDAANNTSTDSAPVSVSTPSASTGLVAAYAFEAGIGTTAADTSGNGNHGTLTNGPVWTTAGRYGNAVSFDGVNDHVLAPDSASLDLGATGTIEAWVKIASLNRWHGVIAKGSANANQVHNYALEVNNANRFQCIWGNGGAQASLVSTLTLVANQFYHVACVWTGTSFQLYVNGAVNTSTPQSFPPAANTAPLSIGQFGGNTDRLNGVVDEVRVYNRALSGTEIQADMNAPILTPANAAPTITAIANQATNEDTPTGAIPFIVGDAETAAGSLTVTASSDNLTLVPSANITIGGAGANRTVAVAPAPNQSGVATITLTVSDGQLSTPTSFQLTVAAVNDAPTITSIASQTTTAGAAVGPLAFTVGDAETAAGSLTVTGSSDNLTLVPSANITLGGTGANRSVTVMPAAGQTGTATITLTVSDGLLSAPTSFQLTVAAVNDPPTITVIPNQTTSSGVAVGPLAFTVGDPETGTAALIVTGSSSNTTLVPTASITFGGVGANRTVTVAPAAGQSGTAIITVTVSDGQLSTPTNFQVIVAAASGLRAAYAFSESAGTTTADASGNLNTGTLTNGPVRTGQGRFGNAITFDGVNDFVSASDGASLDLGATGTLEAWVRLDAINRWHGVIAKGNANNDAVHNYALEITNVNRVRCILGSGGSSQKLDSTVTITTGQLRHYACTWSGTTLSLYIDGILNASAAQVVTPAANTAPLFVGQFGGNTDRLSGTIDEVRIYDRALAGSEIQADMNTPIQ